MYNVSEIDLHNTNNIPDALDILERELFLTYKKGIRRCVIIHGIGKGVLAQAVHEALSKNPMIKSSTEAEDGGSCVVSM